MSVFEIYLVLQLDNILGAFCLLCVILGFLSFFWFFAKAMNGKAINKKDFILPALFLIALFFGSIIPETKTAAAMIVIPKIANNEQFKGDASEIYKLATDRMKELLKGDEGNE